MRVDDRQKMIERVLSLVVRNLNELALHLVAEEKDSDLRSPHILSLSVARMLTEEYLRLKKREKEHMLENEYKKGPKLGGRLVSI